MLYLINVLDLIAGLLIGANLWIPAKYLQKLDNLLITNLAVTNDHIDKRTICWSILFTALAFSGILIYGYINDVNQENIDLMDLTKVSLFTIIGMPIAIVITLGIINLYRKLKFIRSIPLFIIIAIMGMAAPFMLLLLNNSSIEISAMIIGYVFSLGVITILLQLLPLIRRFFTFSNNVLARIGITLFVVSRFIQIYSM
ncbi:MAG: hypothetical protein AAC993_01900 [Dehalococcoides mccartyi]|uniref:hypothetical protein n=1 Tax=Dehalococcoides mccartyi TaxID=61435 RepID=UPI0030F740B1